MRIDIHGVCVQSTPTSGAHANCDGAKRRKGSKEHAVVDILGHLIALRVSVANEQDRAPFGALACGVQAAANEQVELAYIEQDCTGAQPAKQAFLHSIELEVVKLDQLFSP